MVSSTGAVGPRNFQFALDKSSWTEQAANRITNQLPTSTNPQPQYYLRRLQHVESMSQLTQRTTFQLDRPRGILKTNDACETTTTVLCGHARHRHFH
jgi:hypothetical protein